MELLSKTRVINQLLQRASSTNIEHENILNALRDMVFANVFLIEADGTVLGCALAETGEHVVLPSAGPGTSGEKQLRVSDDYAYKLVREDRTLANLEEHTPFCAAGAADSSSRAGRVAIIPIIGSSERIATLLLTKHTGSFAEEDVVLAEYSGTVIGYELTRLRANRLQQEGRDRSVVQMAVDSLSYSELEAVEHIFNELNGREGLLVASRIADRVGITRSVIVNALRKLESAGVVEARSLGMKGTHIKVLNEKLLPLLENMKSK